MSFLRKSELENYLQENLPASEERIPVPMDPACEVCVVIPCYEEREYILNPLESLARQEHVGTSLYEVIVVVNNPGHPPLKRPTQSEELYKEKLAGYRRTLWDNRQTLELIGFINGECIDTRLSAKEKEIVAGIKQAGLKVFAVDKSSKGKTLPDKDANVGGARNRGAAEAIERFHTQAKRNGILAHTDADTRFDEYYICSLIDAFKDNPQLVGVAGIDEDILADPWDRETMKHFLWGKAKNSYQVLLHRPFFDEPFVFYIQFVGSNMATRAYETAILGGISKKAGDEDTQLGREIAQLGETALRSDIVNFPLIRYSMRTTTGKGNLMAKAQSDKNSLGQINVRTMETAALLTAICNQLKETRLDKKTSVEELRKILTLQGQPILEDDELTGLSQNMAQFTTCRKEFLNPELHKLVETILNRVDERQPTVPLREGCALLLDFYFKNRELKKRFIEVRTQMILRRKDALATLERVMEKIFADGPTALDLQYLVEFLTFLLEREKTPLISQIFVEKKYRIKRVAQFIKLSRTKAEAMELVKINYMPFLFLPEDDPVLSVLLDLNALTEALQTPMR